MHADTRDGASGRPSLSQVLQVGVVHLFSLYFCRQVVWTMQANHINYRLELVAGILLSDMVTRSLSAGPGHGPACRSDYVFRAAELPGWGGGAFSPVPLHNYKAVNNTELYIFLIL